MNLILDSSLWRFSIKLFDEQKAWVEDQAELRKCTEAAVVRAAIDFVYGLQIALTGRHNTGSPARQLTVGLINRQSDWIKGASDGLGESCAEVIRRSIDCAMGHPDFADSEVRPGKPNLVDNRIGLTCSECGGQFVGRRSSFCSQACRFKNWRKRQPQPTPVERAERVPSECSCCKKTFKKLKNGSICGGCAYREKLRSVPRCKYCRRLIEQCRCEKCLCGKPKTPSATRCIECRGSRGERWQDRQGYIWVRVGKGHPGANSAGLIAEHRLVMQNHIGRALHRHEIVHHVFEGSRQDNRIENLQLWSTSHPPGQRVTDKIAWAVDFLSQYGYTVTKKKQKTNEVGEQPTLF